MKLQNHRKLDIHTIAVAFIVFILLGFSSDDKTCFEVVNLQHILTQIDLEQFLMTCDKIIAIRLEMCDHQTFLYTRACTIIIASSSQTLSNALSDRRGDIYQEFINAVKLCQYSIHSRIEILYSRYTILISTIFSDLILLLSLFRIQI